MMEHDPKINRDEQYPLLKVEDSDGGGDTKTRMPASPTVVTTSWSMNHSAPSLKQSWLDRWPEFMSACWMTLILLAISFLVFYALGMSAYRRQPVIVFKCNNSKPASDVYFHHIVSKGSYIPFAIFSEYLSTMASQYPYLRFNVYFLVDDSNLAQTGKRSRLFKRLVPAIPGTLNVIVEQSNKREIRDFQRRYQNVNVTIMPLSKYMGRTPLRYKWKNIPLMYLPFYARIFSVWQTGGIGMDLLTFNNMFNSRQNTNYKLNAILKQHNDGIETEKYVDILNSMDHDDENEIFSLFYNVVNHILNQTSSFFNLEAKSEFKTIEESPLIRTHRSKREIRENPKLDNYTPNVTVNSSDVLKDSLLDTTLTPHSNLTENGNETNILPAPIENSMANNNVSKFKPSKVPVDFPQVLILYDFLITDDIVPSYPLPFASMSADQPAPMKITEFKKLSKRNKQMSNHLSVSSDGLFVAASMCYHPFLAQLLSTGCKRENPTIAIKDTLMSQCSTFLRDDVYCDNIHVLNTVF
ncbi:unnamed protein product [Leptosia nina]|uniref:Uncharacterized protein n=1 Tax=Leptosia nina TaxID=320188 RepID=A0AAV1JDK7_9NEOP